jgi:diguanylate cyclase (GGDEF)-like protein/PAS domain S-box-containing protein
MTFIAVKNKPLWLLTIVFLLSLMVLSTSILTIMKTRKMDDYWYNYSHEIVLASQHINTLEHYLGYGGFIHHFKNLVLRHHSAYNTIMKDDINLAIESIHKFRKLSISQTLTNELNIVESTLSQYKTNLDLLINTPSLTKQESEVIDKKIKVRDIETFTALNLIRKVIDKANKNYLNNINKTQNDIHLLSLSLYFTLPLFLLTFMGIIYLYLGQKNILNRYNSLFNHSPNSILEINAKGEILEVSNKTFDFFQYSKKELIGQKVELLLPEGNKHKHVALRDHYIKSPIEQYRMNSSRQVFGRRKDGSEFPIDISLATLISDKGTLHTIADISDASEKCSLTKRAQYDHLTRLFNRSTFEDKLNSFLISAHSDNTPFTLMMIDVDHFKRVNDEFGHLTGDRILIQFSDILHKSVRKNDFPCRWGGEEFMVLAPNLDDKTAIESAQRLRIAIENYVFDKVGLLTCSIGVTTYIQGDDSSTIIKRADQAVYEAKATGRNKVVVN